MDVFYYNIALKRSSSLIDTNIQQCILDTFMSYFFMLRRVMMFVVMQVGKVPVIDIELNVRHSPKYMSEFCISNLYKEKLFQLQFGN